MRTLTVVTALAMALTPALVPEALAQKADRYPDPDLDGPRVVRTIPITPSFNQRWFGPAAEDRWISNQPPPSDRFTPKQPNQPAEAQNASTGLPEAVGVVPVPGNRLRHDPIVAREPVPKAKTLAEDTRPAQVLCARHGLKTVWFGSSWRCKR